jgi:hypothetical protein
MSDSDIENQLRPSDTELNRRIALLEEKLLEKERAMGALHTSENRYRRLFESAKDGILILDADTGDISGSSVYSKTLPHPRMLSRSFKITNTSVTMIYLWKLSMGGPLPWSLSAMLTGWTNSK